MNANELKAYVASHFRYERQAALVAFEASDNLINWSGEPADVLVVTDRRLLYEIEVKISISDLKHDKIKRKHYHFQNDRAKKPFPVNRFYFALPKEIAGLALEIIENMYPYAGLLSVNGGFIDHLKEARLLHTNRLTFRQLYDFTRQQSGTVCRLARDFASNQKLADERWQEICQLRKNLELQKAINSTLSSGGQLVETE